MSGCSELHSFELMQALTRDDSPSFLHIPTSSPVRSALDIGCGDGHWVAHAADVWGAHGAQIIGVSIPPSDEEQTMLFWVDRENVKLLRHNLYVYMVAWPHVG
jgi:SAM-dependent methyltransferase